MPSRRPTSDKIKVYSFTGQNDAIQAVKDGKLEMTVMNRADDIAAETCVAMNEYFSTGSHRVLSLHRPDLHHQGQRRSVHRQGRVLSSQLNHQERGRFGVLFFMRK